ncbi:hypothetical protein [Gemmatimonas sp.]
MGDMAEPWRGLREDRQSENAARYATCVAQLAEYPYHVPQFNHGAHWRVDVLGVPVDFWPHTGTYRSLLGGPHLHGRAADFNEFLARARSALAVLVTVR